MADPVRLPFKPALPYHNNHPAARDGFHSNLFIKVCVPRQEPTLSASGSARTTRTFRRSSSQPPSSPTHAEEKTTFFVSASSHDQTFTFDPPLILVPDETYRPTTAAVQVVACQQWKYPTSRDCTTHPVNRRPVENNVLVWVDVGRHRRASEGNRTLDMTLEVSGFTIKLHSHGCQGGTRTPNRQVNSLLHCHCATWH